MNPWTDAALAAILLLNTVWFGAGAVYFGLTPKWATKLVVARPARQSPLVGTVAASLRFLGGMNFTFAVFSGALVFNRSLFAGENQMALLMAVIALAHGTQFAANLPVALAGTRPAGGPWPVLSGPMFFIFMVDFSLLLANAAMAIFLFSA